MSDDHHVYSSPETSARLRKYERLTVTLEAAALGDLPFIPHLLTKTVQYAGDGLDVGRSKVLQYRPEHDDLLMIAGIGWDPKHIGHTALSSDMRSPPGRAVRTGEPTFIDDLPENRDFDYSAVLREHNIVSVVNVPIKTQNGIWGVLEVDSTERRQFNDNERAFLTGLADIIGRKIGQSSTPT
jgi:GAF domain-containing protein